MKTVLRTTIAFLSFALALVACNQKKLAGQPALPPCIAEQINAAEADPAHAKISRVERYQYKGQTVYYIVRAQCYDCMNTVYNEQCVPVCSPDGGFSGRGDGRCKDFATESSAKTQVWPRQQ